VLLHSTKPEGGAFRLAKDFQVKSANIKIFDSKLLFSYRILPDLITGGGVTLTNSKNKAMIVKEIPLISQGSW